MTTAMQQLPTGKTRSPGFSDEWEKRRFGDICTFLSTANNPRADLEEHGAVGYVHYGNIHAHPLPVLNCTSHDLPRIEESRVGNAARLRDGDLVMVDASEDLEGLGKSVEVMGVGSDDIVAGLHTILCRGDSNHWAAGFKAYLQYIPSFKSTLARVATGISVYAISKRQLADIVLALPPPDEQRAIAEALSDVDGLLESLESLIAKKQAVKQATMQQLLTGNVRLPGLGGMWKRMALGQISDIKNGSTPSTRISAYWNGWIPWCTPTDITDTPGKYLLATERNITEEGLASCAATLLPVGALLLCSRATIGEIKVAGLRMCTNQGFKSLVCKDDVSNEFLYYLLKTLKPKLIERAIGSTFLEIGKREVASIEVNLPPLDEQRAIAAVLSDMDTEIASLEQRRDKTRALKQGMMQQFLTGRIRLARPL